MVYYFCSEYNAALKLNGIYCGILSDTAKSINIDNDSAFIEVLPITADEKPVCMLLDGGSIDSPPNSVSITDLKGGYLIKFLKNFSGGDFDVISQQKFPDLIITIFNDKGAKLSIDTANDFFVEKVDFEFSSAEFFRINSFSCGKNILAVVFYGKLSLIRLYDTTTKPIRCIFSRTVNEFSFEKEFITTENVNDMAKHKITCSWDYDGNLLQEKTKTVSKSDNFIINLIPEKLLPFAFTEELFVGGNVDEFLAENLQANADKLKGFFGDFIGVFPPPPFMEEDCVGVIYPNGKNKYIAEYFYFEISNGKITGIKKGN